MTLKTVSRVMLLAAVTMSACDDPMETSTEAEMLTDMELFRTVVEAAAGGENLVVSVDTIGADLVLALEDGQRVTAPLIIFQTVTALPSDWTLAISLSLLQGAIKVPFLGTELNFAQVDGIDEEMFPLVQQLSAAIPHPGRLRYVVNGRTGRAGDIVSPAFDVVDAAIFSVVGLYAGRASRVSLQYLSPSGSKRITQDIMIEREALPFPSFQSVVQESNLAAARLLLLAHRSNNHPLIIDQLGDVRWTARSAAHYALQQAADGTILFAQSSSVWEITVAGEVVGIHALPEPYFGVHHDVHEMADRDLLLTVNSSELSTIEDVIVLMDRGTGAIKQEWDLNLSIPRNYELIRDTVDWLHVNAVDFDERDRSLVISGQRRGLYKVTWDNELKWVLSDPRGFEGVAELLDVGSNGAFWGQHDIQVDEATDSYYVFDNGLGRNYSGASPYSRAVRFRVDESAMTAVTLREWGSDRPELYSPIISGLDYDAEGRVLVNFGSTGYSTNYIDNVRWGFQDGPFKASPAFGAALVEYDASGQVRLEIRVSNLSSKSTDAGVYRARYVDLFSGWLPGF
jgi:arylsulfate sulfotransferase